MSAEFFLDTNILLYGFDKSDLRKKQIAETLVERAAMTGRGVISSQVCQEFCNVMLLKNTDDIPLPKLANYLETVVFGLIRIYPSPAQYLESLRIHRQTQYRFYDSLIVAAAIESGAPILYSEDLQHEPHIGPLQIINPFL